MLLFLVSLIDKICANIVCMFLRANGFAVLVAPVQYLW